MLAAIQGNLGSDPEHRALKTTTTCKLRVALRQTAAERERNEPATWVDVVAYGAFADALAPLHIGDAAVILGNWKTDAWVAEDGSPRSKSYVLAFAGGLDLAAVRATPKPEPEPTPAPPADPFEE